MRILYVVHQLLPPAHVAGTEIYAANLATAMRTRGHEVAFFFTEGRAEQRQYELNRGTFRGIPYHEAVFNHSFAHFEETYKNERMEPLFEQVLDEVQPDLVHCQHLALHSIGYLEQIAKRALPIVYTLHEYMLMCPRNGQLLRPGLQLCDGPEPAACAECVTHLPAPLLADDWIEAVTTREQVVRGQLEHVDLFLSPSAFLRQKFIDTGWIDAARILHSDNGFLVEAFENVARSKSDKLRVGYIGTIADYKGVHVLIDAFAGIDPARAECHIHGDLDIFPDYGRELRERELPANVHLEGRFDNTEVGRVLADIDVLVIPSLWFENSPLTIHEAYLAGIPVIATDHGGMAELVLDGVSGLHFKRGDAADLRAKIQRFLDEPGLKDRMLRDHPPVKTIAADAEVMETRYTELL